MPCILLREITQEFLLFEVHGFQRQLQEYPYNMTIFVQYHHPHYARNTPRIRKKPSRWISPQF